MKSTTNEQKRKIVRDINQTQNLKTAKTQGDRPIFGHGFEGDRVFWRMVFGGCNKSPEKIMVNNYDNHEKVNKFVGILDNGTYVFLDKLFSYDSGLCGATGTRIIPVSEEYVEERIKEFKDYECSPVAHIYDEQQTDISWNEWINQHSRRELEDLVVDPSGGQYWSKVEEVCEKHEEFQFYTTDCIGGGRMFSDSREANPDNYQYLENPELLEMARKAENGEYFD